MTYESVKRNYERGLWNKAMVKMAVVKGVLTIEEYEEIVGEPYPEQ